jgi:hypothetical protein
MASSRMDHEKKSRSVFSGRITLTLMEVFPSLNERSFGRVTFRFGSSGSFVEAV